METKFLDSSELPLAITLLKQGEVVALPTETVYGLAADPQNQEAVDKVFTAKKRPKGNPLILHVASFQQLQNAVLGFPDYAKCLAKAFWPGPLTLVLPKKDTVSSEITAGQKTVAVRMANHPTMLEAAAAFEQGLVAPSANPYTKISPTKPEHVFKSLEGRIAAVVDGGPCLVGIESTIVDCTGDHPWVLREGGISIEEIQSLLGDSYPVQKGPAPKTVVPGQHKKHYSPSKPLILVDSMDLAAKSLELLERKISFCGLGFTEHPKADFWGVMPGSPKEYARLLYDKLHEIDSLTCEVILVESPPYTPEWGAVRDRLKRASSAGVLPGESNGNKERCGRDGVEKRLGDDEGSLRGS